MDVARICFLFVAIAGLSGCATVPPGPVETVRKVDCSRVPEMKEMAVRARQIGDEMYPKILALLVDDPSKVPRQFDIIFRKHLRLQGNDECCVYGSKIYLNAELLEKYPADFDFILIHEMTHVAQQYPRGIPFSWEEGIANFVPNKFGHTNGWNECPQCDEESPDYTFGYSCAGAFLLYVDETCGSNVIRRLNTELRRGSYSDAFFAAATGKSLDELWGEFKKTPAFRPPAAEAGQVREALGYVHGKPSKEIHARFVAYMQQLPGGDFTLEAIEWLKTLKSKNQMPGFSKSEPGDLALDMRNMRESRLAAFPVSRTLYCRKKNDRAVYNYTLVRTDENSPWKLQKAWRTTPDNRVLEDYTVP